MSGNKSKSRGDVAGSAKKLQLLHNTMVLFKVLYCKIKNALYMFFYVLSICYIQYSTIYSIVLVGYLS